MADMNEKPTQQSETQAAEELKKAAEASDAAGGCGCGCTCGEKPQAEGAEVKAEVDELTKATKALEEANAKGGAEAVREAGLKFAVQQIRTLLDNGAPGIHLYTLNKASMCLRIAEEVGAL